MKYVTQIDIKEMNQLYLELGTYAAVARATGFSPSTVKKYIIPGYTPPISPITFDKPLPEFDPSMFRTNDWGPLCKLSDEELNGVIELWKELDV